MNNLNLFQMMQQFNQFKNSFSGDPKEEVEKLMREGKISQAQLNNLQSMANEFMDLMKTFK